MSSELLSPDFIESSFSEQRSDGQTLFRLVTLKDLTDGTERYLRVNVNTLSGVLGVFEAKSDGSFADNAFDNVLFEQDLKAQNAKNIDDYEEAFDTWAGRVSHVKGDIQKILDSFHS